MGNAFQDLQQDKESFSTLNVALFNQKDDIDLHVGLQSIS